jgi:hypothetical protein
MMAHQARLCWWQPRHPGWDIWDIDTEQFMHTVAASSDAIVMPPLPVRQDRVPSAVLGFTEPKP